VKDAAAQAALRLGERRPRRPDEPTAQEDIETVITELRRLDAFAMEMHLRFCELDDQHGRMREFVVNRDAYKRPE
jgi:hypothetical protein